jgi:very-short-patch-repair endonuclease
VATRQERVITCRQLHEIGLSDRAICARVKSGRFCKRHRGVYQVGPGELTVQGRFLAAVLAIGEDALLADMSAGHLWGFWPYLKEYQPVQIVVPRRVRSRPGIHIQVARVDPSDTTTYGPVPIVTPSIALLQMAATLRSDRALRRAVHEAQMQGRVSIPLLQDLLERSPVTRAARRLAAIVKAGSTRTRSFDEDEIVELLRRHQFPRHETNSRIPGLPDWVEVDIYFPDHNLAIEVDSPWHDTEIRKQDDARKQTLLESHGIKVVRLRKADAAPKNEQRTASDLWRALT